jgi:hypothetical protein
MKTYNNVLSEQTFSKLKTELLSAGFPWFYYNTTYDENRDASLFGYSFYHLVYENDSYISNYGPMIELAVLNMLDRADEKLDKLLRIRIGMITVTSETIFHQPHVDYDFAHRTGLFYINSADGDTTIYNEKFDNSLADNSFDQYKIIQNSLTIKKTITPQENTFVVFDGLQYHQSSTPTTVPRRIVININYTIKE